MSVIRGTVHFFDVPDPFFIMQEHRLTALMEKYGILTHLLLKKDAECIGFDAAEGVIKLTAGFDEDIGICKIERRKAFGSGAKLLYVAMGKEIISDGVNNYRQMMLYDGCTNHTKTYFAMERMNKEKRVNPFACAYLVKERAGLALVVMLVEDLRHIAQHLEQPADPAEAVSCTEDMYEETLAHIEKELKTLLEFVNAATLIVDLHDVPVVLEQNMVETELARIIVDLDDALDVLEQNMVETELARIQVSDAEGMENNGVEDSVDDAVAKPSLKHQLQAALGMADARIKALWEEYNKAKEERRTVRSLFSEYESFHFVGRSWMKGFNAVTVKTNCRSKTQREEKLLDEITNANYMLVDMERVIEYVPEGATVYDYAVHNGPEAAKKIGTQKGLVILRV